MENKDLTFMLKSHNYDCPICNTLHNDHDLGYEVDGEKYPKYYNERKGWNGDLYHDWQEVHKCKNCKTEYHFDNGAY